MADHDEIERLLDGFVCCGDAAWRGRHCQYHQGMEDADPEDWQERYLTMRAVAKRLHDGWRPFGGFGKYTWWRPTLPPVDEPMTPAERRALDELESSEE